MAAENVLASVRLAHLLIERAARRVPDDRGRTPMYLAGRIFAGITTLALAGTALVATVPSADAATQACGSDCVALVTEDYGPQYTIADIGFPFRDRHITLATAGPYANEDFQREYVGNVAGLYAEGIVGPALGQTWPRDWAYQYVYAPDGNVTDLCLGVPGTATQGTVVYLYPCGVNATTIWVPMYGYSQRGYEPLITGTDTNASTPYVLTAGAVGGLLTTTKLSEINHLLFATQMWQNEFGVLPAPAS
jgi:hypothetical protein